MNYESRMVDAIAQARAEIPAAGWYQATENAALDHGVSLPELQRLCQDMCCAQPS